MRGGKAKRRFHRGPRTILCVLLMLASGCYTVPQVGRKSLMLIDFPTEIQLGMEAFEKLKEETPVSSDEEGNAMVRRVGERIARVADPDIPGADWEFVLFEDDTPNAFALPGGKVGVNTGLLPIAENDAGLATVLGHEIAHVAARHGAERMSRGIVLGIAGSAVSGAVSDRDRSERDLVMLAYGIGTALAISLPFSRQAEYEADRIGLIYMARAGYDPREALAFWRRMMAHAREEGTARIPEFLSTHPMDEHRIAHLEELIPYAEEIYRNAVGIESSGPVPAFEPPVARGVPAREAAPVRALLPAAVRALPVVRARPLPPGAAR